MKQLLLLTALLSTQLLFGQLVFSETFDEAADATSGSDAVGGVTWNSTCPGSVAASDYFKVVGGKLEARDTNSPAAEWTTSSIDISSCSLGFVISFDLEESGEMEDCADCGGTGEPCIDWVKAEYNVDGMGWTEFTGFTCALAASPGEMIQIGDIGGGSMLYTSPCGDIGTNLEIRLSCMSWAGNEYWHFDNIEVNCTNCLLPLQLDDFSGKQIGINSHRLAWKTRTVNNIATYEILMSEDGQFYKSIGSVNANGNSQKPLNYEYINNHVEASSKQHYYKLKQVDFDGNYTLSKAIIIDHSSQGEIHYSNGKFQIDSSMDIKTNATFIIYQADGKEIYSEKISSFGTVAWNKTGLFFISIPEIGYHQKIFIQ
ncbi:hypothetical protein [Crocinitomix algicola]|uniref:hypothetical protein n=1 Tax=Crocinitomix algicola TaxID=1740263 RepID=UPI000872D9F3|nr:hypothetical protein [Crocinitomix algicola]